MVAQHGHACPQAGSRSEHRPPGQPDRRGEIGLDAPIDRRGTKALKTSQRPPASKATTSAGAAAGLPKEQVAKKGREQMAACGGSEASFLSWRPPSPRPLPWPDSYSL